MSCRPMKTAFAVNGLLFNFTGFLQIKIDQSVCMYLIEFECSVTNISYNKFGHFTTKSTIHRRIVNIALETKLYLLFSL